MKYEPYILGGLCLVMLALVGVVLTPKRDIPFPSGVRWWEKMLCAIGFHKWDTIFGWHEHLNEPHKSGYYGQEWCARCGFSPTPKATP